MAQTLSMSALSTQYVQVPVTAFAAGVAVNPTGDTVQLAFTTIGATPTTGDWHTGSWDIAPGNNTYLAQVLVGPAGVAIAKGTYQVWVKVTDNPEIPVVQTGTVTIF